MTIFLMNAQTQSWMTQMVMIQTELQLQLITAEAEIHENFDATRLNEEQDHLNLQRVRMLPPHFCL